MVKFNEITPPRPKPVTNRPIWHSAGSETKAEAKLPMAAKTSEATTIFRQLTLRLMDATSYVAIAKPKFQQKQGHLQQSHSTQLLREILEPSQAKQ